jgi:hypothetical protein
MGFFRSLETIDLDADEFITFAMKHHVPAKDIRKLESQYQQEMKAASVGAKTSKKKKTE